MLGSRIIIYLEIKVFWFLASRGFGWMDGGNRKGNKSDPHTCRTSSVHSKTLLYTFTHSSLQLTELRPANVTLWPRTRNFVDLRQNKVHFPIIL